MIRDIDELLPLYAMAYMSIRHKNHYGKLLLI